MRAGRIAAVLLLSLGLASAQTNRTWTGAVDSDWFKPGNWSPAGAPAANDILNFPSGTITLTAPVTISNQFNWTGGILSGAPMTIAASGTMTISGATTLALQNALTNAGTVNWT